MLATLLSPLAFVPSCIAVMKIADQVRFGVFQYAGVDAIWESHVRQWLPPAAKEVTVRQHRHGFEAKYTISKAELDAWHDAQWRRSDGRAANQRKAPEKLSANRANRVMEQWFAEASWSPLTEPWEYEGPHASNGAGSMIWFDEAECLAYQRSWYW
ncbi:MAG TPA: hypothetical protein VF175_19865 [Lacipirellula sp.]